MAYTADLIIVLKLLFEQVTQLSSSEAPKVTREALNKVYQAHKTSDDRQKIYRRIGADFRQKQQIPGRDGEVFHRLLRQSLEFDPVSPPDPRGAASSPPPPSSGVATSSHSTVTISSGTATPLPSTGVARPPPHSARIPLQSPQSVGVFTFTLKPRRAVRTASSQSTSPPFWRYHRP